MEKEYIRIINTLKKYQEQTGVKGYVLGVSGGKDSSIVARILCDAIGKENVLGVLMPNGDQSDISYSWEVVETLDIDSIVVDISGSYNCIINQIHNANPDEYNSLVPHFDEDGNVIKYVPKHSMESRFASTDFGRNFHISDKAKTNIAPRLRMTTLYAIAQTLGYRVAGTGNASEIYIGWFTKWGDSACDINPIAHLTCTEVIALGDYLGLPEHLVHKTPADGLTGKSDEENFGFTYKTLDEHIRIVEPGVATRKSIIDSRIIELHKAASHKTKVTTIQDIENENTNN